MRRIVVGMDGSAGATTALRWAVHEADLHHAALTALYAWNPVGAPGTLVPDFDQERALGVLRNWMAATPSEQALDAQIVCDLPTSALLAASADADLVVLGSRGLGGFRELLLGSVSSVVAERAACPVAVVRETASHPLGPIVVGVDGSMHSTSALRWAAAEARARDVPLEVVHAWSGAPTMVPGLGLPVVLRLDHLDTAAEHRLTRASAEADLSGIAVHRHVVEDTPAGALVRMSTDAAVVVVGSRGRGGLTAILLGSTGRHLLHHAHCPVVIVR